MPKSVGRAVRVVLGTLACPQEWLRRGFWRTAPGLKSFCGGERVVVMVRMERLLEQEQGGSRTPKTSGSPVSAFAGDLRHIWVKVCSRHKRKHAQHFLLHRPGGSGSSG